MQAIEWIKQQTQRLTAKHAQQENRSFWFGQIASGAKIPLNRPFRLADTGGVWPKPDRHGYRVRHSGPNRHERRKIAVEMRGQDDSLD